MIVLDRLSLQDWPVPVAYEVAPLRLFSPSTPAFSLSNFGEGSPAVDALPATPDTGFFGRDETLLALDRALDANQTVLLHAFAGSGKTTTVVEFARWYRLTGGLDEPGVGQGPIIFTSFELHKPLSSILNDFWDVVSQLVPPGHSAGWLGMSLADRRRTAIGLLSRIPALWIWDNVEPLYGFPKGVKSAWLPEEQADVVNFLRELHASKAKVVITSRRREDELFRDLPTRVSLPPMAMLERFQLARAIAERSGRRLADVEDWRPLLRFTEGNPLTLTVMVREALRAGIRSRDDVEQFVENIRAGAGDIADEENLGRSRSLGASLSYGFASAFCVQDRALLALLHFFQRTVSSLTLAAMLATLKQNCTVERVQLQIQSVEEADVARVLQKAAEIGLLTPLNELVYLVHPALPWYFHRLFTETFGPSNSPATEEITAAYVDTIADLGSFYSTAYRNGQLGAVSLAALDEPNFLHARHLSIRRQLWEPAMLVMQGLQTLYEHTGRDAELSRLAEEIATHLTDWSTQLPAPEHETSFLILTEIRTRAARRSRNAKLAEQLLKASIQVSERRAAIARALPMNQRTYSDRMKVRSLGIDYQHLALALLEQHKAECVGYLEKALPLFEESGDLRAAAGAAANLANVYLKEVPELENLDEAEKWLLHASKLYGDDRMGRSKCLGQLAQLYVIRLQRLVRSDAAVESVNRVLKSAHGVLDEAFQLTPNDAIRELLVLHEVAAVFYRMVGRPQLAMHHRREEIRIGEQLGDSLTAGSGRERMAVLLMEQGQLQDAALFAEHAIRDYEKSANSGLATEARALLERIQASRAEG
jgi:tetratricopeptide (TPR) repeat protein